MKNKILLSIFIIITLGCSPVNLQRCRSTVKNNIQKSYSLETMCNYKTKITEKLDSGNELLVLTFKDNSKIFITNEIEYCPPFSLLFLSEKQTGMFTFNEQLTLNGIMDDLTTWRIEKREGFILGYYNVPKEIENQYINYLLSLERR